MRSSTSTGRSRPYSPRSAGNAGQKLPAFDKLTGDEWTRTEYRPPDYLEQRGIPIMGREQIAVIARSAVGFVEFSALSPLSGPELLRAMQWDATWHMLGRLPEPVELRRNDVLAASDGEISEAAEEFAALLQRYARSTEVLLRPRESGEVSVSFFLDNPRYSEWPAFTRASGGQLLLGAELVALIAG